MHRGLYVSTRLDTNKHATQLHERSLWYGSISFFRCFLNGLIYPPTSPSCLQYQLFLFSFCTKSPTRRASSFCPFFTICFSLCTISDTIIWWLPITFTTFPTLSTHFLPDGMSSAASPSPSPHARLTPSSRPTDTKSCRSRDQPPIVARSLEITFPANTSHLRCGSRTAGDIPSQMRHRSSCNTQFLKEPRKLPPRRESSRFRTSFEVRYTWRQMCQIPRELDICAGRNSRNWNRFVSRRAFHRLMRQLPEIGSIFVPERRTFVARKASKNRGDFSGSAILHWWRIPARDARSGREFRDSFPAISGTQSSNWSP